MPKKRLVDLTPKIATGTDVLLVGNDYDTFVTKIETLPINTTAVLADHSTFARTLGERFAEVVNVKDYGAVGDGLTNDGPAINDAFLNANGKTVYFPSGVYAIEGGEINLCSVVHVAGYNASILQTSLNTPCFRADFTTTASITIEGLEFIGYGVDDTANPVYLPSDERARGCGVLIKDALNCNIRNCTFRGFKNAGLYITNGKNVVIENNTFIGTRNIGIPGSDSNDRHREYKQCGIILDNTDIDTAGECKVLNNHIRDTFYGIYMYKKYPDTVITGNVIKAVGVFGMRVNPSNNLVISDNIISAYDEGISVVQESLSLDQNVDHIRIFNNTVENSSKGIVVQVVNNAQTAAYSNFYISNVNIYSNIIRDLQLFTLPHGYDWRTDIFCKGVEVSLCRDIVVYDNNIFNFDGDGIIADNCDGSIHNNIIKRVRHTGIGVTSAPEGRTSICDNIITDSALTTSNGIIDALHSHYPTTWLSGQMYTSRSYVTSNNKVYKCTSKGGTSSTTAPNGTSITIDGDITWQYVGPQYEFPQGEYDIYNNLVTIVPESSAHFGLFTNDFVRVRWGNNTLPQTLSDGRPLYSLIRGSILSEKDNTFGGYPPPSAVDLLNTYVYEKFSNGTPARNFIHTEPPQSSIEGYWLRSDRVWNSEPSIGNYVGWICTSAGSPGQWSPFGYLGVSGTAANYGVPNPGDDASNEQVVLGSDSRLTDNRYPTSHASIHHFDGTDPLEPSAIHAFDIHNNFSEVANTVLAKQNLEIRSFADYDMPQIPQIAEINSDQVLLFNYTTSAMEWVPINRTTQINKYIETIGNGLSSHFIVQHNLNSTELIMQVYDLTTATGRLSSLALTDYSYDIIDQHTVDIYFDYVLQDEQCKVVIIT